MLLKHVFFSNLELYRYFQNIGKVKCQTKNTIKPGICHKLLQWPAIEINLDNRSYNPSKGLGNGSG